MPDVAISYSATKGDPHVAIAPLGDVYTARHCEEGDDRDSVIARALARGNLIRSNISSETTGDPHVAIAPRGDVTLGVSYRVRSVCLSVCPLVAKSLFAQFLLKKFGGSPNKCYICIT